MNCVLFAKMDYVLVGKKKQNVITHWKIEKILEKSGNFVSAKKWEP